MSKKFIDISEHNTILSFNAIPESNLSGVVIKATEGTTYIDHAHEIYYDALNGKIPLGFYHYLTSTSSPQTQAQNFWDRIKDKQYQILPILDVEQDSLGINAELYSKQFMETFYQLSGQYMLLYSGRCYIEEHFSTEFKESNIWWVADYSANETPSIFGCKVVGWQYTEDERGYAFTLGNLDVSILEDEENFFIDKYCPFSDEPRTTVNDIATLQNELIVQGFTDKNGNELIIDGVAGELTLSACPLLKTGAQGNITKWVQNQLEISADGIFGEETRQAVLIYQEDRSIDGDGVVGKNTWRKLLGM
jgi:GH25 family lysozyme M1 (1,4-beta-N-acetylmuramidase)